MFKLFEVYIENVPIFFAKGQVYTA